MRQAAAFVVRLVLGPASAALLTLSLGSPAFAIVTPNDPLVMTMAAAAMTGVAFIAATFPAVRASRVDPVTALRTYRTSLPSVALFLMHVRVNGKGRLRSLAPRCEPGIAQSAPSSGD